MASADPVVMHIGGASLRIGRADQQTASVRDVVQVPLEWPDRDPGASAAQVQPRVLDQIAEQLATYLARPSAGGAGQVGVAIAGLVTPQGLVTAAPTVWGAGGAPVHLGEMLRHVTGRQIVVRNDLTAAVWRYAMPDRPDFCLLAIGSGIGAAVYRQGDVLTDRAGVGGELGHWPVDLAIDAPVCDCGRRGHLAAFASARGILAAARRVAAAQPQRYQASHLAARCGPDPAALSSQALVDAIRAGDGLALELLRQAQRRIAAALSGLWCAIGLRRFIVIGDFAQAVGQPFLDGLTQAMIEVGCFGLTADEVGEMVSVGAADDEHSLIGMAALMAGSG